MKPSVMRFERRVRRLAGVIVLGLAVTACVSAPQGRPTTAATASAVKVAPLLDRAEAALAAGAVQDARAHYQMVLQAAPENPRARLGLAEIRLMSGDTAEAGAMFAALTDTPEVAARAWQGVGLGHLIAGEVAEALPPLQKAVAADPSLWRAWNALGTVHDRQQDWAAARDAYDKALAADTAHEAERSIVYNNLGFSLVLQGRYDEAVPHLLTAARAQRDMALPRTNLRLALAWQGRYRDAVAGARPDELPEVLNNVGYIALLRGDYGDAEALLTRALEASPSYYEPARNNLEHLRAIRGEEV